MNRIRIVIASFVVLFFYGGLLQADELSLLQQGQDNLHLGRYREATAQLQQLEEDSLVKQDDYTATLSKGLQGYIALQQNKSEAEQLLKTAFTQAQKRSWNDLTMRFAVYLGELNEQQQNFTTAKNYFSQAQNLAEKSTNSSFLISILISQAKLLISEKQFQTAWQKLQQAEKLLEILSTSQVSSELWLSFGYQTERLLQSANRTKLPVATDEQLINHTYDALNKALAQSRQTGQLRTQAASLNYLAVLYKHQQRNPEAIRLLLEGIKIAEKANADDLLVDLESLLGELLKAENRPQSATTAYRQAVLHLEDMRLDIPVSYQRGLSSFRETFAPIYLALADLLLQQSHSAPSTEKQKLLQEAQNTIELMKKSEMEDYFKSRCGVPMVPINLKEEDPFVAEVYPVALPNRLEIIVNSAAGLAQFTQPVTAKNLEKLAREFSSQLRNPLGNDVKKMQLQAQILYQWLIEPIKPLLDKQHIDTLIYIPDGALRLVPLAALFDGHKFLIEDYALVTSVGVSMVDRSVYQHKTEDILLAGLSVPGDVVMDLPNSLLGQLLNNTSLKNASKRQLSRDLMFKEEELQGEKLRELREVLLKNRAVVEQLQASLALPGVETEIKNLASQNNVPYLLNEGFSLAHFEEVAETHPYKILHIASHGFFGSTAENSFIMTYDKIMDMNTLESFLSSEYFRANPLDLITLSACQTAEGDDRSPLGISGIAIKSRVRSALGSLWSVSDEATADLMSTFYQALKTPGMNKVKALQKAEINLLRQKKFSNPSFWSPFILVGDWL